MEVLIFLVLTSSAFVAGQRPFYAGSQPIGFYVPAKTTTTTTTTEILGDRVGEDVEVTTLRLPIEANGDRDLIERLSKLPIDKQPFWFINWQALENHRKNPQTYPQRPNTFINPITPTATVNSISEFATVYSNSNFELGTTDSTAPNSIATVTKNEITTNADGGRTNDYTSVTNSLNSVISTTADIRSTKFENNDSEFITEDPSFPSSIVTSRSPLPITNSEITTSSDINID